MAGAAHTPGLGAFADTNPRHPPVLQHHTFHGSLPEHQLRLQRPKTPECFSTTTPTTARVPRSPQSSNAPPPPSAPPARPCASPAWLTGSPPRSRGRGRTASLGRAGGNAGSAARGSGERALRGGSRGCGRGPSAPAPRARRGREAAAGPCPGGQRGAPGPSRGSGVLVSAGAALRGGRVGVRGLRIPAGCNPVTPCML